MLLLAKTGFSQSLLTIQQVVSIRRKSLTLCIESPLFLFIYSYISLHHFSNPVKNKLYRTLAVAI